MTFIDRVIASLEGIARNTTDEFAKEAIAGEVAKIRANAVPYEPTPEMVEAGVQYLRDIDYSDKTHPYDRIYPSMMWKAMHDAFPNGKKSQPAGANDGDLTDREEVCPTYKGTGAIDAATSDVDPSCPDCDGEGTERAA